MIGMESWVTIYSKHPRDGGWLAVVISHPGGKDAARMGTPDWWLVRGPLCPTLSHWHQGQFGGIAGLIVEAHRGWGDAERYALVRAIES